jgi:hypothetical protein
MSASRGRGRPPTSTNPRNVSRRKENRHLRRKVFINNKLDRSVFALICVCVCVCVCVCARLEDPSNLRQARDGPEPRGSCNDN